MKCKRRDGSGLLVCCCRWRADWEGAMVDLDLFVGRSLGRSVGWLVGRSVVGSLLARSLACWKEVSLLQLKRCFYIGTNTVYSGRHPAAIIGMNWNKSLVREITRSSARNPPKKVFVTSRISAGFLPVEVEHCPKTAQFLRNSGSCHFAYSKFRVSLIHHVLRLI